MQFDTILSVLCTNRELIQGAPQKTGSEGQRTIEPIIRPRYMKPAINVKYAGRKCDAGIFELSAKNFIRMIFLYDTIVPTYLIITDETYLCICLLPTKKFEYVLLLRFFPNVNKYFYLINMLR